MKDGDLVKVTQLLANVTDPDAVKEIESKVICLQASLQLHVLGVTMS